MDNIAQNMLAQIAEQQKELHYQYFVTTSANTKFKILHWDTQQKIFSKLIA